MKKIVIDKAGNYERLKIQEFPDPKPGKREVLIEVYACGVNFADCVVRMGLYQSAKEFVGWPITPGFEVAGIIVDVGEDATRFEVGQKVIAMTLFGGYTTHLITAEDQVFALPEKLSFAEGAAIPAVFLTAYYALFELAHPNEKDTLLIHSAAGGVGGALVQLGKVAGCRIIGVVGAPHKTDYVKSLGADEVIDKTSQDLWSEAKKLAPEGFDVILDANGAETLLKDYQHLASGGKLVVYGFHTMFTKGKGKPNWIKMFWDYWRTPKFNPFYMTADNHSILAFNLSYLMHKKELLTRAMNVLLILISEKQILLPSIKCYQFEDVAKAHYDLETGQTIGKLVLTTGANK